MLSEKSKKELKTVKVAICDMAYIGTVLIRLCGMKITLSILQKHHIRRIDRLLKLDPVPWDRIRQLIDQDLDENSFIRRLDRRFDEAFEHGDKYCERFTEWLEEKLKMFNN
jgi:hypothetical protein